MTSAPERGLDGWFILVLCVAFVLGLNIHLNHFYTVGGFYTDTAWFAWLSSHSVPPSFPNPGVMPGDFVRTHLSPIFWLYTAIGRTVLRPLSVLDRFAVYQAAWLAVMAVGLYAAASRIVARPWAAAVGLACTFNGMTLAVLAFPHVELAIPAAFIGAAGLWLGGGIRPWLPLALLFAGANVREDAGLHYFGYLAVIVVLWVWYGGDRRRLIHLLSLAGLLAVYAIVMIVVQKVVSGGDDRDLLGTLFIGDPPYGHLTSDVLSERVLRFGLHRPYVWAPWCLSAAVVVLKRFWLGLAGHLAVLPWLLFVTSAAEPRIASLEAYYSFPLIFFLAWPLFAIVMVEGDRVLSGAAARQLVAAVGVCGAMSALLTAGPAALSGFPHPARSMHFGYVANRGPAVEAVGSIEADVALLGDYVVDDAVAALMVATVDEQSWIYRAEVGAERRRSLESILFQEETLNAELYRALADEADLEFGYRFRGTKILLMSREERPDLVDGWSLAVLRD